MSAVTEEQRDALEAFDPLARIRTRVAQIAQERGHWSGCPMPVSDMDLIVEPKHPMAEAIKRTQAVADAVSEGEADGRVRSSFYSTHLRSTVVTLDKDGRVGYGIVPLCNSITEQVKTLGASVAWGIEQESNAVQLLATLLPHHAFKKYLLCGAFLESSTRSGVTYLFRRLRPTVALKDRRGHMKILAALCLHPIAYYEGSWAGAMCPTDDVIAHLMLMRANEPLFWRRANQHAAHHPSAGL